MMILFVKRNRAVRARQIKKNARTSNVIQNWINRNYFMFSVLGDVFGTLSGTFGERVYRDDEGRPVVGHGRVG